MDAHIFRLGVGADSDMQKRGPGVVFTHAAARGLDAYVHAGDMSYNDDAHTERAYYAAWKRLYADAGWRALTQATPVWAVLDNHETGVEWGWQADIDAGRLGSALGVYDGAGPWHDYPQRRVLAGAPSRDIVIERVFPKPLRRRWGSFTWAAVAEIFVMDVRSQRDAAGIWNTPARRMMDDTQLDALLAKIITSTARFRIIVTSTPMSVFNSTAGAFGGWDIAPVQREYFLGALRDSGVPGIIFVTGDFHMSYVARVTKTDEWLEVGVGPSGNSFNNVARGPRFLVSAVDSRRTGTYLTFDARAGSVDVEIYDANFETIVRSETFAVP